MSSWSQRRKLTYAFIVIIAFIGLIGLPIFSYFYKAPTCSDGKQNGSEQGIDCGGSCQRLCQSAFLSPTVSWTRFEQTAPGFYNVAAYIVNPNPDGEAIKVPYRMHLYDNKGLLISEYDDKVTLPPHRNTIAFKGAVSVGQRIPAKALFEFISLPDWHKRTDPLSVLSIGGKEYVESDTGSSLSVHIKNNSAKPVGRMSVSVVLYDIAGNTLGFSRTILDGIDAGENVIAPFTWPMNRNGKVVSIEALPVSE